jgi:hypothetical protein
MTNAKAAQTPLSSNWDPKENKGKATAAEITRYQSIIGSLLYLMMLDFGTLRQNVRQSGLQVFIQEVCKEQRKSFVYRGRRLQSVD